MKWDTLIAGISNDVLWGKIIKKGPDVTLAQVLEMSRLETATQESPFEMSNTKPSVNYVRYNKEKKGGNILLNNNKLPENSMDLDFCL